MNRTNASTRNGWGFWIVLFAILPMCLFGTGLGIELSASTREATGQQRHVSTNALLSFLPAAPQRDRVTILLYLAGICATFASSLLSLKVMRYRREARFQIDGEDVQRQSEEEKERLLALLEAAPDFIGTALPNGYTLYNNKAFRELKNATGKQIRERLITAIHTPASQQNMREVGMPTAMREGSWTGESTFISHDGREIPVSQLLIAHKDAEGNLLYLSTIARDMSRERAAAEALRCSEAMLAEAQAIAHIGSWEYNVATKESVWSEEMFRLMEFDPKQGAPTPEQVATRFHPEDVPMYWQTIQQAIADGQPYQRDIRVLYNDGTLGWLHAIGRPVMDTEGRVTHLQGTVLDITQSKRYAQEVETANRGLAEANDRLKAQIHRIHEQSTEMEAQKAELEYANRKLETMNAQLSAMATTDGLTRLTNHRTFQECLRAEFALAVGVGSTLSVLLVDVDHFKQYNDTFGHPAGDMVLRKVAEVLQSSARPTDLVARYGGEEFAVILTETDAASASSVAERFRAAIEAVLWPERQVTVSIGAATLSPNTPDPASLTANADGALYRSKRRGRNCVTHAEDPLDLAEQNEEKLAAYWPVVQQILAHQNSMLISVAETVKESLSQSYDATVESWACILDYRDKETEGHSERVTEMTVRLARAIGMNEEEVLYAKWGARLHDIGKMGVPDAILHKTSSLTEAEWEVMRSHTEIAYEMLSSIPFLGPAVDIPYCHHEKWDGSGYPRGLKGDDIPLAARLFAVIDVYDALRSDRPYRPAWSEEEVQAHLLSLAGTHFDPRAVDAFLKMMRPAEPGATSSHTLQQAA